MRGPLFTLALVAYIGTAVYSIGRVGSPTAAKPVAKATPAAVTRTTPQITLTSTHPAALATFYNEVFMASLQPVAGAALNYAGQLNGTDLRLCPLTKGKAERRRQPLQVEVADIGTTLARVAAAGGAINGKLTETARGKRLAISDPDGNPLELLQNIE